MIKKLTASQVILGLAALAILYALTNYSGSKSGVLDSMTASQATYLPYNKRRPDVSATGAASCCVNQGGNPQPSNPLGQNEVFSGAKGSARAKV